MPLWGLILVLFLIPAPAVTARAEDGIAAIRKRVEATTLPSGWRVDCREDHFKAERTCFAGTFGEDKGSAFQIQYINDRGPIVSIARHSFPGRTATIRVDSGEVLNAHDAPAVVAALRGGKKAYVVFHVWPDGERRTIVDVSGFDEAYRLLLSKL